MKTKEKEMTVIDPQKSIIAKKEETSVESFIMVALEKGLPVDTLERLFSLQEKVKAERAKEAYYSSMSSFQGECPIIEKKKNGGKTSSGAIAYKFATIESIVEKVSPIISKNGFSYSFKTETFPEKVKVSCITKHKFGHSEVTEIEMPNSTKTNVMSAPQVVAATITFAKRYAFLNAFGITVGDEDTENLGKEVKISKPPINMKADIMGKLKTLGIDISKKEIIKDEIFKLTQITVSDDESNLIEIINRLNVLISEKSENN